MSEQNILLQELNANKVAIEQKANEIQTFIQEKNSLVSDLSKLQNVVIPAQEKKVNALNQDVKDAYATYNARISSATTLKNKNIASASGLVRVAKSTRDSKKRTYDSSTTLNSLWKGRYDNGCKSWRGSFRGSYCGESNSSCYHKNRKSHNYESNPPSYCLTKEVRNARNNYAKNRSISTGTDKNNALTNYERAVTTLRNAETNLTNQRNSKIVDTARANKSNVVAQEKAYQDAKDILKNYLAPNGDKDRKTSRVAFVDKQIEIKNSELQQLENERSITEVNYKKALADEQQRLSIIANQSAEAEARRVQAQSITDGSIQNALNQNQGGGASGGTSGGLIPNFGVGGSAQMFPNNMNQMQPKQASTPMFLLIGLVLVGGGYLFMKNKK